MGRDEKGDRDKRQVGQDLGGEPAPQGGVPETDWKAKAEEHYGLFLRARADYENLTRRTQREVSLLVRLGKKDVFLRLLDLADNLERAETSWRKTLAGCTCGDLDGEALVAGVEMIARQLQSILAAEGVRPIEAVGCAFDPSLHECVATWQSPDVTDETISDEVRRGYTLDGEVLRAAQVRVARPGGQA